MALSYRLAVVVFIIGLVLTCGCIYGQPGSNLLKWSGDGNSYVQVKNGGIVRVTVPDDRETVLVGKDLLTPQGRTEALTVRDFAFTEDGKKVLIFTNARRVWR